ncbi:serine/threonine-protein kinase [Planctomycetes bacterium K23_9]|uniref:Serine/threonine-protein kinase PrkC n=1 Tax=Stieleria marina TaxID=1930275 RepID=A0A517NQT8_9BACT|nr:Serine/threonine-protein kinase PrkC [Planctomycetes bacterium K23_9]
MKTSEQLSNLGSQCDALPRDDALSRASAQLTDQQQQRLTYLLDDYLAGLENGVSRNVDEICEANPDLADAIQAYLVTIKKLYGFAAGMRGAAAIEAAACENVGAEGSDRTFRDFQLDDFKIIRELGRGGMGIVYEAHQQSINRRVALKILPMASMLDERQLSRFKNESRAAGQLQHPHIVSVFSVGSDQGIHYYTMQLIDGTPIDAWIQQERDRCESNSRVDWRRCVTWAIHAADALHCAHENGIVHRDIKPSNLILDASDKIWVTDFGLARFHTNQTLGNRASLDSGNPQQSGAKRDRVQQALTHSGDLLGTIRYMSPEQATGHSELIDHRTDIYSLAATLFELLTLEPAVEGENGPSLLSKIASESTRKLTSIRSDLPTDLSVVLQKAMANSKDDRYFTADQFAVDLRAVLDGRATVARPPSWISLTGRYAARHKRVVTASVLATVAACIGLIVGSAMILSESQKAKTSGMQAQQYFNQARATVDHLGTDVATRLASVPGAERIRQDLLHDTLQYYEQFVAQASHDPSAVGDLARTYHRIGVLTTELHSSQQAVPHFQRSVDLYAQVIDADSDLIDDEILHQSAENLNSLGLALVDVARTAEGAKAYAQARAIQQSLVDKQPGNIDFATQLALIKNNTGLLARHQGDLESARQWFADANDQLESLVERCKANGQLVDDKTLRTQSAALANASSVLLDTKPKLAIGLLEQAIAIQASLALTSSHRLRVSQEIAALYNNLASAYSSIGNVDQADIAYRRAIGLQRKLHAIAPLASDHGRALAISLNNLAMTRQKQSRHSEAADLITEALSLQGGFLGGDKRSAADQSRLGAMLHNQAISALALEQLANAERLFKEAIKQQNAALVDSPTLSSARVFLGQHYSQLLKCQLRLERWHELAATTKAYHDIASQTPGDMAVFRQDLAEAGRLMPADLRRRLTHSNASEVTQ